MNEIGRDGRHGRVGGRRERTNNLYGRDYRSREGTEEMEMGNHGRMHAGSAAHHSCDGLGPVHSERMKDNEWVHAIRHSERASEIDGDGRHWRAGGEQEGMSANEIGSR